MILNNCYASLPKNFYEIIKPTPVSNPKLVLFNQKLAQELQLNFGDEKQLADYLSGNMLMPGSKPIAIAYAGHQYGHFVPELGDGRAVLLGDLTDVQGKTYELQLKGSGRTRFSRNGDGRAALGPMIREYIVSEFMHAVDIPSTRSLAVIKTGEKVNRETDLPGAILARLAKSHVRIGTFEYFAAKGDYKSVKILADYMINRYYIDLKTCENCYELLLKEIIKTQASLIAKWMQVGFIHGVMNTDNISVIGETIDYGPCAFIDFYEQKAVYSSIDKYGRYAYNNQAKIAEWNLIILVRCFLPLLSQDITKADLIAKELAGLFMPLYQKYWQEGMAAKIGIQNFKQADLRLINELLELMESFKVDFTLCFRYLGKMIGDNNDEYLKLLKKFFCYDRSFELWLIKWQRRLKQEKLSRKEISQHMCLLNPVIIPRNHLIELVIKKATEDGDISAASKLVEACANPFDDKIMDSRYSSPPSHEERVYKTYCGT